MENSEEMIRFGNQNYIKRSQFPDKVVEDLDGLRYRISKIESERKETREKTREVIARLEGLCHGAIAVIFLFLFVFLGVVLGSVLEAFFGMANFVVFGIPGVP